MLQIAWRSHDFLRLARFPSSDRGRSTVVFFRRPVHLGRDFGPGRIISHEVRGVIRSNLPLFPLPPPPPPPHLAGSLSSVPRSGGSLVALVLFRTYTRALSLPLALSFAHLSPARGILTGRPRSSLVVTFGADSRTFSTARKFACRNYAFAKSW